MRLRGRPTLQTLVAVFVVFAVGAVMASLGPLAGGFLVLTPASVTARPWTLVTSVYAHAGVAHLLGNVAALAVVGPLVGRRTTATRYHAFVVGVGAVAGLTEVAVGVLTGTPHGVLGLSGAVLGLLGYLLAGNAASARLLDGVDLAARAQVGLLAVVVVVLTAVTSGPGSAVVGHATGLTCGLVAGRAGVLDATRRGRH